jgi:hypothetical protein
VVANFSDEIDKEANAKRSNEELRQEMMDVGNSFNERMTAAWLLLGTKRYGDTTFPTDNDREIRHVMKAMVDLGLSRLSLYIAHRYLSRIGDSLFVGIFLLQQELWHDPNPKVIVNTKMPKQTKIGSLLAASYDQHTREGRVALRRFEKESQAVQAFRKKAAPVENNDFMGFGIFCAEGGMLATRMDYHSLIGSEEIRRVSHQIELEWVGLPVQEHEPFLDMLRQELPHLNHIREDVVRKAHES